MLLVPNMQIGSGLSITGIKDVHRIQRMVTGSIFLLPEAKESSVVLSAAIQKRAGMTLHCFTGAFRGRRRLLGLRRSNPVVYS
jgi:hypothetical protein